MFDDEVKNFDLATILSLTTKRNLTNSNNQVIDKLLNLVQFIYDDELIPTFGLYTLTDHAIEHIFRYYPELKDVTYEEGTDVDSFMAKQTARFGNVLPINRFHYEEVNNDTNEKGSK